MTGEILDLRRLKCPMPALLARKALDRMMPGACVTVLADDPLAVVDIPHMCHRNGHAVEGVTARDGFDEFLLRSGPRRAGTGPAAPLPDLSGG